MKFANQAQLGLPSNAEHDRRSLTKKKQATSYGLVVNRAYERAKNTQLSEKLKFSRQKLPTFKPARFSPLQIYAAAPRTH
ncbi:hypothetical protein HU762_23105 [Pseudomonas sp. SWRI92]|uniref:hypothetical protein n=1 Tax=Pseudomonas sp. SWRI92 TaxID=2745499 RepID=UPI0016443934|nr:hypothetical protein [Pseudomonas sp. SWRI92]MBC3376836.1 hypothetical protein [Pseudomonas sp. SWRI92]